MIIINEETKIPKCPTRERPINWRTKTINKTLQDGLVLTFEVLLSRASAEAFIYDTLYNYNFPMVQRKWTLKDYAEDPQWYEDDMLNWETNPNVYFDDSVMTYCDFGNGVHVVLEEDGLQGAIKAFQKARNVIGICQSTGWDTTIYNGYIYYDEDYDDWRADIDLPNNIDFDEHEWENVGGTFIEKVI